jgi:Protein of unknown function (DUF998)
VKKKRWQKLFFQFGVFGTLQFLVLTVLAMMIYPGGTIHHPEFEQYNFLYNYFSDLGRTFTFDGSSNWLSHLLFRTTLTVSGICLILFFIALPSLFKSNSSRVLILIASFFGVIAGVCYIGIANVPWNLDLRTHHFWVYRGFISFLLMCIFYSAAILLEKGYPNRYAKAFGLFGIILFIQIVIMIFGPRAYRSNGGLLIQAVAQKVVVYSEILVMLFQAVGALAVLKMIKVENQNGIRNDA